MSIKKGQRVFQQKYQEIVSHQNINQRQQLQYLAASGTIGAGSIPLISGVSPKSGVDLFDPNSSRYQTKKLGTKNQVSW
jgi:hypothetical protein